MPRFDGRRIDHEKLLFASLLTVAVVFGATITLDDTPPEKKQRTKSTRSGSGTDQRHNAAIKSGSGGHVGGGSGAGRVSSTESSKKLGGSHGDDTPTENNKTKTPGRKGVRKKTNTTSTSKLEDKERRK